MRSSSVVPVRGMPTTKIGVASRGHVGAGVEEALRSGRDQRVVGGRLFRGVVLGDAAPRLRAGHQRCPRLVRLAEGVELLEQAVVQVGDVVVVEVRDAPAPRACARCARARRPCARTGRTTNARGRRRGPCDARPRTRRPRRRSGPRKLSTMPSMWSMKAPSKPLARARSDAAQRLRLVFQGAVQAAERRAAGPALAGCSGSMRPSTACARWCSPTSIRTVATIRMSSTGACMHALARLEGVEGRFPGQARRHGRCCASMV